MKQKTKAADPGKTAEKAKKLETLLSPYRNVALAFSGGVDSTFLLAALCKDSKRKVLALTAGSPAHPAREQEEARRIAQRFPVEHREIVTDEILDRAFRENPPDRCYHCKKYLFSRMQEIREREGYDVLMEGSNKDDLKDYRPGTKALHELNVMSPLLEAGLTKTEIRELSRRMDLPTWNKPSLACLASRFPYGTKITEQGLQRIDRCEAFLLERVQGPVRVRFYESTARIEVDPCAFHDLLKHREAVTAYFREQGFRYITLDLEGYRTGSMNEVLENGSSEG